MKSAAAAVVLLLMASSIAGVGATAGVTELKGATGDSGGAEASRWVWSIQTVDSQYDSGNGSCIDVDAAGNPRISYLSSGPSGGLLKYASWNGASWSIQTVPGVDDAMGCTASAVDATGKSSVFLTTGTMDLKYAGWNGATWSVVTLDTWVQYIGSSCVDLDSQNYPHVSYVYWNDMTLKPVLAWARYSPTGWQFATVDNTGTVSGDASMDLTGTNVPHFTYPRYSTVDGGDQLTYTYGTGPTWTPTRPDLSSDCGYYSSIEVGSDGYPRISYFDLANGNLKYARKTSTAWSIQNVDTAGDVGRWSSLALDSSGNPLISYYDMTNGDLKFATWTGSAWAVETVDSSGRVGVVTSIAVGPDGTVHISYYDATNGDLKYAKRTLVAPLMTVAKTAPATASSGDAISYTITFSNIGTDTAHAVTVVDSYPPELVFVSAVPAPSVSFGTWIVGDMAPGTTQSIVVTLLVPEGVFGTIVNVVNVYYDDDSGPMPPAYDDAPTFVRLAIQLDAGWNLFSVPTLEAGWDLQDVLAPVQGDYDAVQAYDAASGRWLSYETAAPGWLNSLDALDGAHGYWIHMTSPGVLTLYGDASPGPVQLTLEKGWNLAGYPTSRTDLSAADALAGVPYDGIQAFDGVGAYNLRELPGSERLEPGNGYWIHVTEDCVWTVAV